MECRIYFFLNIKYQVTEVRELILDFVDSQRFAEDCRCY